jgi:hypothetical protein
MAQLSIDSGPVDATDNLRDVPRDQWFALMQVRRDFLGVNLPYDCRLLLRFVEDAHEMHGHLGFASVEDFIQRGLDLDPDQVGWALEGLKRMQPNEPVPYKRAIELGKREIGVEGGKAGPGRGYKTGSDATRFTGRGAAYLVARLKRDHPGIAAQLAKGEFRSARAAAIAAGIVKVKSPLEKIQKLWGKLDAEGRRAHLDWTLRRCATCGQEGLWMKNDRSEPQGLWCDACCETASSVGS